MAALYSGGECYSIFLAPWPNTAHMSVGLTVMGREAHQHFEFQIISVPEFRDVGSTPNVAQLVRDRAQIIRSAYKYFFSVLSIMKFS